MSAEPSDIATIPNEGGDEDIAAVAEESTPMMAEESTPMMAEKEAPPVSPELQKMVPPEDPQPIMAYTPATETVSSDSNTKIKNLTVLIGFCALAVSTIILGARRGNSTAASTSPASAPAPVEPDASKSEPVVSFVPDNTPPDVETIFAKGTNKCYNKNPNFENVDCIHTPGPQAGANVTKGFVGGMEVDFVPNTKNYWQSSMCPVNVHWHLGTEHYSVGEYDEFGDGPNGNADAPEDGRRLAEEKVRGGFRCHHYDAQDPKFTKPYEWKHCIGMEVGETYEVHWPHSAAGACGTVDQYQTPFYDGVFCNLDDATIATLGPQDIANAVGVQGQIYTVVNDEAYFYPDMIRSWIVDGEYGQDIAIYTGSTTGTKRSNEICSQYTPITWQVDRKCHLISASSFDKLCYDMKNQRDDMGSDLHAHGSRKLVKSSLVANNQANRKRKLREHDHHHHHAHGGHDHHHHHHQWY